jgi:hypothetical protein
MPYAEGRVYHDADSHVMETPDWLVPHAEPAVRARLRPLVLTGCKPGEESFIDELRRRREDPAERAAAAREIMLRKNWSALGAFVREDRPRALDALGFASQLVFNTFLNPLLLEAEHGADLDWAYGFARAHNRALLHFCAVDRRLLPTAYVPLADFDRARAMAEEAIAAGAKALLVASACPARHSPSHTGLFPVWAAAEEAGASPTACRPCRTSTAAPRTSAPSTTWRSRVRRCRCSRRSSSTASSLKRFADATPGLSARALDRFYAANFVDLMGAALAA